MLHWIWLPFPPCPLVLTKCFLQSVLFYPFTRYSFPHSKISTSPPIMNRVFGQAVDAQLQANELEYATKYYAAILARATGKDLETCQKNYLSRKR